MDKGYKIINLDDKKCIEFYGEIDDSVCFKYRKEISEYIEDNKTNYIFDFKHVSFIDSSGIGFILARYNQLKGHRKKLFVKETNEQIKKLFRISGIYTIIEDISEVKVGER